MKPATLPPVYCPMEDEDGNAFSILGRWSKAARKAGWPNSEIDRVLTAAKAGDYDHLLQTILANCEESLPEND